MANGSTNSFLFRFWDSIQKGLVGLVSFTCSIIYLNYYVQHPSPTDFQIYLAILASLVFTAFVVWAIGREAVMTALHVIKEVWRMAKGENDNGGTKKKTKKGKSTKPS